jgi:hypothetical protein
MSESSPFASGPVARGSARHRPRTPEGSAPARTWPFARVPSDTRATGAARREPGPFSEALESQADRALLAWRTLLAPWSL